MTSPGRAVVYGFLVWLIPFVVAFAVSPLKESWRPLFESIMPVTLSLVVVALAEAYFRVVRSRFIREGVVVGCLWWAISIVIDLPLMMSPPMSVSLGDYAADVGLTYLMIPIITTGMGAALAHAGRRSTR